jgi:excisionase family DNA binding protein
VITPENYRGTPRAELIADLIDSEERRWALYQETRELEKKLKLLDVGESVLPTLQAVEKKFNEKAVTLRAEIHRLKRENQLLSRQLKLFRYTEESVKLIQAATDSVLALRSAVESKTQPLLTTKEVAALLRCSVRHVAELKNRRVVPVVKLGSSVRFRREAVLGLLAKMESPWPSWR